jgi:cytochrome c peroxidase
MSRLFLCILLLNLTSLFPLYAFQSGAERATTMRVQIPIGLNKSLWRKRIPKDNPLSVEKVALGRALYFDKRLSIDGTVSCATCHDPALAFTDAKVLAVGGRDRRGTRNAPTILNVVFNETFFWDGRASSLEDQVKHPLLSSFEMGMTNERELTARLSAIHEYQRQFKRVFKSEGLTIDTIAMAIAAYERTLLSGNSPFDRFIAGQQTAVTEAQKRGLTLFKGKAKCIECHTYSLQNPFFTDFKFHNTGVAVADAAIDELVRSFVDSSKDTSGSLLAHSAGFSELGRFAVTLQPVDVGAFKTPMLRDLELTSPYMHDGSIKTLIDVVQFYNRGGNANRYLDKRIQALQLTDAEVNDLVEFLRSLTSDDVLRQCQTMMPQTRTAVPF